MMNTGLIFSNFILVTMPYRSWRIKHKDHQVIKIQSFDENIRVVIYKCQSCGESYLKEYR